MKKFFEENWPFIPFILVIIFLILLIGLTVIGDIYGHWSVSNHGINYQSDNQYNDNGFR